LRGRDRVGYMGEEKRIILKSILRNKIRRIGTDLSGSK
jgi:hypothetical protein